MGLDRDSWGIDHGSWSVLVHAFPDAEIPVVQLAINATKPFEYHFELGARLAPLRHDGVLVIGSGNVVHNLGLMDPRQHDSGTDWAHRFDEDARADHDVGSRRRSRGGAPRATSPWPCPTPDHFIPLLYLAGLADAAGDRCRGAGRGVRVRIAVDDLVHRRLRAGPRRPRTRGAPRLPGVPPDGTNL